MRRGGGGIGQAEQAHSASARGFRLEVRFPWEGGGREGNEYIILEICLWQRTAKRTAYALPLILACVSNNGVLMAMAMAIVCV